MRTTTAWLAIAFLVSLVQIGRATPAPQDGGEAMVTVCALAKAPARFNGTVVTVAANIKASSHYSIVITDLDCEGKSIALVIPNTLDNDGTVKRLRAAVFAGYPEARNKSVRARITGEFRSQPGKVPARILVANKIEDLKGTDTNTRR